MHEWPSSKQYGSAVIALVYLAFALAATAGRAEGIISAGNGHTCALLANGSVRCWGNNEFGQADPPLGAFTQLSAGANHTCGLLSDGTVRCWGNDINGQASPPEGTFVHIAAARGHTCGVGSDGRVICWGRDWAGEGRPPEGSFTAVSLGYLHSCGLGRDGQVVCWGDTGNGQGSPPDGDFVALDSGFFHTCGLTRAGDVRCWGDDSEGQASPPAGAFRQISAGDGHTCGIQVDGTAVCWGDRYAGGTPPPQGGLYAQISAGNSHSCGVQTDGAVHCWGFDVAGRADPPAGSFGQVSVHFTHSCGLAVDGAIRCWGSDSSGQASPPAGAFLQVSTGYSYTCGIDSARAIQCWGNTPGGAPVPPGAFEQISTSIQHACGRQTDGGVRCWGEDEFGATQTPPGRFTDISTQISAYPSQSCGVRDDGALLCWGVAWDGVVSPLVGQFGDVDIGGGHGCAVGVDGTVACVGDDDYGQASPPEGAFTQVAAGALHTCGLRTDNTVSCWGRDDLGQATPPAGAFAQLSAGWRHTCGVRLDGNAECWGFDGYGPIAPPGDLRALTDPSRLEIDPTRLFNISTNGPVVGAGLQAGFIVNGPGRRFAVMGEAADGRLDAQLTLAGFPDGEVIANNATWSDHPTAGEIETILRAPASATDAAFAVTLGEGAYVATLGAQDGVSAPGIVSVTALDDQGETYPLNISTQGSGAMIAGFIVTGSETRCYIVKAEGVGTPAMADPALVVGDLQGVIVDANDQWRDHPSAPLVEAAGFAPPRDSEAALALRLSQGVYLAELFSMGHSGNGDRAIIAATEVPATVAAQYDCEASTPYRPIPVDDTPVTLAITAPRARCVERGADDHCTHYQARTNIAVDQWVRLGAQGRGTDPDEILSYTWFVDATAQPYSRVDEEDGIRLRFQEPGNKDVRVTMASPSGSAISSTIRLKVLAAGQLDDQDGGR